MMKEKGKFYNFQEPCLKLARFDIVYGLSLVSHYMESPTITHMKAAKRILHYIKGTIDHYKKMDLLLRVHAHRKSVYYLLRASCVTKV